ncbi:hypothetical protein QUF80_03560 [Desulfococcaceae bacterium HSG8]|nr:hypothetical protein [Desulfococcaceae bacterium HSG8]
MTLFSQINERMKSCFGCYWGALFPFCAVSFLAVFIVYVNLAFPENRCDAVKHLEPTEMTSDCFRCHTKTTPKIARDWYESKHGVTLVKCFVCHGQPDGKGSVPFAVDPDADTTCRKCHDPSIRRMEQKYGITPRCNECHPYHQNSIHHEAYVKPVAKKKID